MADAGFVKAAAGLHEKLMRGGWGLRFQPLFLRPNIFWVSFQTQTMGIIGYRGRGNVCLYMTDLCGKSKTKKEQKRVLNYKQGCCMHCVFAIF